MGLCRAAQLRQGGLMLCWNDMICSLQRQEGSGLGYCTGTFRVLDKLNVSIS